MRKVGKVSTPRPSIVDVTAVSDVGFAAVAADCSREAAAIPSNVTVARYVRLLFIWDSPLSIKNSRPPFRDGLSGNDGLRVFRSARKTVRKNCRDISSIDEHPNN